MEGVPQPGGARFLDLAHMLRSRLLTAVATTLAATAVACRGEDAAPPVTTATTMASTTSTTDADAPTVDGILRIGVMAPDTGAQAAAGPAWRAAAALAVEAINDAGGVLGQPVEVLYGDSGDATTDTAGATVDTFSGSKVDVIVGPASSAVTALVLDKVARSTAVLVNPGNALAEPPADVPYLQLAPSLELLGQAAAQQALTRGLPTALIVARNDEFGQRVSTAAQAALQAAGVSPTVQLYNPESDAYGGDVANAIATGPAQVLLVGYAELADFLSGFIAQGVLPGAFPMEVVTDRVDDAVFRRFSQPSILTGLAVVGADTTLRATRSGFAAELTAADPAATTPTFAAQVYDAVVLAALAAERAGTDDPRQIRQTAPDVSGGTDGAPCDDVASCLAAVATQKVTFAGAGGPYRLDERGLAAEATFQAVGFGADNRLAFADATLLRVPS